MVRPRRGISALNDQIRLGKPFVDVPFLDAIVAVEIRDGLIAFRETLVTVDVRME